MNIPAVNLYLLLIALSALAMLSSLVALVYDLFLLQKGNDFSKNGIMNVFGGFSSLSLFMVSGWCILFSTIARRKIKPEYAEHGLFYIPIGILFALTMLSAFLNGFIIDESGLMYSSFILIAYSLLLWRAIAKEYLFKNEHSQIIQRELFNLDAHSTYKDQDKQVLTKEPNTNTFDLRNKPMSDDFLKLVVEYQKLHNNNINIFKPFSFSIDYRAIFIFALTGTKLRNFRFFNALSFIINVLVIFSLSELVKVLYYTYTYQHSLIHTLYNIASVLCILQFALILKIIYESTLRSLIDKTIDKFNVLMVIFAGLMLWYVNVASFFHAKSDNSAYFDLLQIFLFFVITYTVSYFLNKKVLDAYKPSKAQIDAGDVRAKELIKAESDLDSK